MSSLKSKIGKRVGPYRDTITQDRMSAFCQAIGVPIASSAPPTFLTVFRRGEFDLFEELGIALPKVLHAEQEYQYDAPLLAGDRIRFETTVTQALEKNGSSGHMQFITFETRFHSERQSSDVYIGQSKTTVVIRDKKE